MKTRPATILLISTYSLIALTSNGVVQKTSNAKSWEVVTTLGDPTEYRNVQQVIRSAEVMSVLVQEHTVTAENWNKTKNRTNFIQNEFFRLRKVQQKLFQTKLAFLFQSNFILKIQSVDL